MLLRGLIVQGCYPRSRISSLLRMAGKISACPLRRPATPPLVHNAIIGYPAGRRDIARPLQCLHVDADTAAVAELVLVGRLTSA